MSPHAVPSTDVSSYGSPTFSSSDIPDLMDNRSSNLQRYGDDEVHDLVCAGFGPASLAIAVALHDSLDSRGSRLATCSPRVRFLEKQDQFAWHAGMLLPGAKMQITFMKDMATLRNPRSKFTFLNYLHEKDRLVAFTNLGTFLPQRVEYEDYMRWCAQHFDEVVDYSQCVESVKPGKFNEKTGAVEFFNITSADTRTGKSQTVMAKNVVIAAGGRPNMPKSLPQNHPRIIHSSQYATHIHKIFPEGTRPRTVAVIGGGQSAAECWHDIPSRFPGSHSVLLIRGSALKPSDDSPFVNEVFNPEKVDDIFSQDPHVREELIKLDKATNYGVVRIELLEQIYSEMYSYQLTHRSEEDWPHRLKNYRTVTGTRDITPDGKPALELQIQNNSGLYCANKGSRQETLAVDLLIVASGYVRNAHEEMLEGLRDFMRGGYAEGKTWSVQRDYAVDFEPGTVAEDARVWLQGCNEKTHGLSDSLLSILAVRGGEMVESIFGYAQDRQRRHVERAFDLR